MDSPTFLLEAYCRLTSRLLAEGSARDALVSRARAFLSELGFDLARLGRLPIGLFTTAPALRKALIDLGFTVEQIRQSRLLSDARLAGCLVGPIRDHEARIVSFWARLPDGHRPAWLFRDAWTSMVPAVGLDVALPEVRAHGTDLVLVEGLLDTLLLHSLGMRNVAGLGSMRVDVSPSWWERLAHLGVRQATLLLEDGPAAHDSLWNLLHAAWYAQAAPTVFAVSPLQLPHRGSLRELVRGGGLDALRGLLKRSRRHGYRLQAWEILQRHRGGASWTASARQAALQEAVAFYRSIPRDDHGDLDAFFVPTVVKELGCATAVFWPECEPTDLTGPGEQADGVRPGEPASRTQLAPTHLAVSNGLCPLHHCAPTDCFCFD